ncbi:calcium-binding protein [Mesorhizobium sp. LHD-90]|uniref:beta strand repeat-containing protein n=1 Tax=Mesorhizobium sp. LHD-90 TaxID=3071414 RepID=UPI0027E09275|nr:calcium-binding protein [Mesorhizobium sp. LHD-90]MDQ6433418.1 calcium-binding protein [Mesorhizobium sp. LHD-90]
MAVTTSFAFGFVESIDPFSITGRSDATSLSDGGVAVVGDHIGHTDLTTFEADGDIAGSASVITGVDSAVTQLSNGNIVVLSDTGTDMSFRIVTTTGATVRVDTSIGESGPDVLDPEVAALTGGGFVVAIQDFFGGTDNDVDLRIYDNDGNLLLNFAADASGANDQNPSVAGLADGGFAVAWHRNVGSSNEMWYAVYEANGTVRKAPTQLDAIGTVNRNASVVALDNGGFAIAYEDNGWSTTDIDITLARFDAAGNFVDWQDIAQNASNDFAPSATVLSNGMIAVGTVNDLFGHNDPVWTLVDQNTGAILTASSVGTTHNDFDASIAAMKNGQLATFHTNATAGDVVGQILQTQRFSTSDAAGDTILVDSLQDFASGNAGDDTFQGGGLDAFTNDSIDGGADFDRILATADISLVDTTLNSIEEIEILFPNTATSVTVRADQIGAGLAADLVVDFSLNGSPDKFRVEMLTDTNVDLSQLQLVNFNAGVGEGDRLIVLGDNDDEQMRGTSVRDELFGTGGNDLLDGGLGGDLLSGGTGSDRATYANAAAGVVASLFDSTTNTGEAAGDTYNSVENLTGSGFADTLTGTNGVNSILGGNDNDKISGLGGSDNLFGNDGNDILAGGAGADKMSGGAGSDRATYETAAAGLVADLSTPASNTGDALGDTYNSIENLTGSAFDDALLGNNGTNSILGGAGDDFLVGRGGDDNLFGNAGNDVLIGGTGADDLAGGADSDRASYETAAAAVVVALLSPATNTGDALGDTFTSIENLTGSDFDDKLSGTNSANSIIGGDGDDLLIGLGGDDNLFGQDGNDVLNGGTGADDLSGGAGSDRATYENAAAGVTAALLSPATNTGEAAGDTYSSVENLTGSAFADKLTGTNSANSIVGGAGNDLITGLGGDDNLFGQDGNDVMIGGTGADDLSGGAGSDTASYSTAAAGVIASLTTPASNTGDAAGDTYSSIENLTGSAFGDTLTGNSAVNVILGGNGADTLNGRAGDDTMTGGSGNDNFRFDTALGLTNVDDITDFNFVNDTIQLDNAIFNAIIGVGLLSADQFVANPDGEATTAAHRIIYETDTGILKYDSNGSALGGSTVFATLTAGLGVTNVDFFVV